ncbi:hypothetical protein PLCT1_00373 [Planctomycetaceae bacterium]|nr:hypothetical protein PLCT1_00373 [Planctomycetaceae bacterium]
MSHREQVARVAREADRCLSHELSALLKANGYEVLR